MSPQLFNLYEPADYSITSLTSLEKLDVICSKNLSRLPDDIGELKSLRKLNVSLCSLESLPDRYVNSRSYCCSFPNRSITTFWLGFSLISSITEIRD